MIWNVDVSVFVGDRLFYRQVWFDWRTRHRDRCCCERNKFKVRSNITLSWDVISYKRGLIGDLKETLCEDNTILWIQNYVCCVSVRWKLVIRMAVYQDAAHIFCHMYVGYVKKWNQNVKKSVFIIRRGEVSFSHYFNSVYCFIFTLIYICRFPVLLPFTVNLIQRNSPVRKISKVAITVTISQYAKLHRIYMQIYVNDSSGMQ